jgi:ABC-2 type transport system permease protein
MHVERTIAWLTVRQLLARRRAVPVLLLTALPVVIGILARSQGRVDLAEFVVSINQELIIRIVLPVIALVLGTGGFGAEREEGTAVYLLTKPVARWRIALAKLATVALLTLVVATSASALTSLAVLRGDDAAGATLAFAGAIAIGSIVYSALFVALGVFFRRALAVGLVYVVVWEVAAAQMFAGTRTLSVRQYVTSLAEHLGRFEPGVLYAPLAIRTAVIMAVAVTLVAAALTVYRLRSFEVLDQQ